MPALTSQTEVPPVSLNGKADVQEKGPLVELAGGILKAAKATEDGDQQSKIKLAMMAKKLTAATAGPMEVIGGHVAAMGEIAALYQFIVWKLFDKIPDEGSISYEDLASSIDADVNLVARLGGMLVSTGRLTQPCSGHIAHSAVSHIFKTDSKPSALYRVCVEHGLRPYMHWAEYFETYGNKEPVSVSHNPFTFGWGHPDKTVWEVVDMDAEKAAVFASAMQSMGNIAQGFSGPAALYDFTWVAEESLRGSSGIERPLIVDVGGSRGETLKSILDTLPDIRHDRCAVQDRLEVVQEALALGTLPDVKMVEHDFFQPNPNPGALVYLIRRVLHDWSDDSCIQILSRLAQALPTDDPRARVLIVEQVVADPPSPRSAAADMIMLNIGGKERSAAGFKKIVEGAGMKIVNIHHKEGSEVGMVECARD